MCFCRIKKDLSLNQALSEHGAWNLASFFSKLAIFQDVNFVLLRPLDIWTVDDAANCHVDNAGRWKIIIQRILYPDLARARLICTSHYVKRFAYLPDFDCVHKVNSRQRHGCIFKLDLLHESRLVRLVIFNCVACRTQSMAIPDLPRDRGLLWKFDK